MNYARELNFCDREEPKGRNLENNQIRMPFWGRLLTKQLMLGSVVTRGLMTILYPITFFPCLMRSLLVILLFIPHSLLAQEGTIEYSVQYKMGTPPLESFMHGLPPGMSVDSTLIEMVTPLALQVQEQIDAMSDHIPMTMHYTAHTSLLKSDHDYAYSPLGFDPIAKTFLPTLIFADYTENVTLSQYPSFDETPYVTTQEFEPINWTLTDLESTILGYPVKQASFSSDSLNAVAWYTPDISSVAGPRKLGGLPGLPLLIAATRFVENGIALEMNYTPVRLDEGLEEPLAQPEGRLISRQEFSDLMHDMYRKSKTSPK